MRYPDGRTLQELPLVGHRGMLGGSTPLPSSEALNIRQYNARRSFQLRGHFHRAGFRLHSLGIQSQSSRDYCKRWRIFSRSRRRENDDHGMSDFNQTKPCPIAPEPFGGTEPHLEHGVVMWTDYSDAFGNPIRLYSDGHWRLRPRPTPKMGPCGAELRKVESGVKTSDPPIPYEVWKCHSCSRFFELRDNGTRVTGSWC